MKLGCSSWSYHRPITEGRLDQRQWLRLCADELELDGVELLDLHFPSTEAPYLRDVRRACVDLGLTVSCVSVSNDFGRAGDGQHAEQVAKVNEWTEIASFLGAPVLRVFAGWAPREGRANPDRASVLHRVRRALVPRADPKWRLWPSAIDSLRQCAAYAGERGVVLAIENHNGRGLVGAADEVERCLNEVASPWLRLNLDTGDYGDVASIERTMRHAVHVHAKLYDLDAHGADQTQDWTAILSILRRGRYRGFLSIEYEGREEPSAAVPRGVRYLRRLLSS